MQPVKFQGVNVTYAEDQPPYQPLPTIKFEGGETIHRWEFTDQEIEEIVRTRGVYVSQWTFNLPLQPILVATTLQEVYPANLEPMRADIDTSDGYFLMSIKDGKEIAYHTCAAQVLNWEMIDIATGTMKGGLISDIPFGEIVILGKFKPEENGSEIAKSN